MLIETARRVTKDLAAMISDVNSGNSAISDVREALAISKAICAQAQAFQSAAAASVAARERHGDGGAAVLTQTAGVSRRQAGAQARTNEMLKEMPAAREAVESGKMSFGNARRLADAAAKTNTKAVDADEGLLSEAASLSEDDFAKRARRWTQSHQADGGEADYARRRAKRYVRFWDGDDGMVHLRGEFDPLTGRRIQNRLEADARRGYMSDKKTAAAGPARSFPQCMADALEDLALTPPCKTHNPKGDGARPANTSGSGSSSTNGAGSGGSVSGSDRSMVGSVDGCGSGSTDDDGGVDGVAGGGCRFGLSSVRSQIAVVAHLDAEQGRLVGELAGGESLPASVLDELFCNAEAIGVLFSGKGRPLWQSKKRRGADDNHLRSLMARDGACVGCGAHFAVCQAHHIVPVSEGGPTKLSNMVLACFRCHDRVHHQGWQVVIYPDQYRIEPPERLHRGPAHASGHSPLFRHAQPPARATESLFATEIPDRETHRKHLQQARAALNAAREKRITTG